ncbi:MAG: hypothetical protein ICV72_13215, partial [Aldersonia sp.]|nr:hypothetical protein [Aldersonia sp.]
LSGDDDRGGAVAYRARDHTHSGTDTPPRRVNTNHRTHPQVTAHGAEEGGPVADSDAQPPA